MALNCKPVFIDRKRDEKVLLLELRESHFVFEIEKSDNLQMFNKAIGVVSYQQKCASIMYVMSKGRCEPRPCIYLVVYVL